MMAALLALIIAAGTTFICTPIAVRNGDGPIWCAEGPKIGVAGISARQVDGSCRPGPPCPEAGSQAARDILVSLLSDRILFDDSIDPAGYVRITGPSLSCTLVGPAGGARTSAWCLSPVAGDLSCAMVRSGAAVRWDREWRGHRC